MHLVLFEPNYSGHRFTHVKRVVPALAATGARITLVTSKEGPASVEWAAQLKGVEHLFATEASMPFAAPPGVDILVHYATHLRRAADKIRPDHVYMPYADGTMQHVGVMRMTGRFGFPSSMEFEGILMRGLFAYETRRGLRAWLWKRAWLASIAASPFTTIHHMDPIVVRCIERESRTLAKRVHLIPDPVEEYTPPPRDQARRQLGLPEDGRYIGCVGIQDRRKGIDRLIRVFAGARTAPSDRLLLMGAHEEPIVAMLKGEFAPLVASGKIIMMDRYISDEELRLGVAAMDVIATPYPPDTKHSGSSSIVIHAAGQDRMVLGCDYGWIGDTITRFGLGDVCDVCNDEVFAAAIVKSLDRSVGFRVGEAGRRFVAFHRPENFGACFVRRLRERMNLPPIAALKSWDWVMEATAGSAKR